MQWGCATSWPDTPPRQFPLDNCPPDNSHSQCAPQTSLIRKFEIVMGENGPREIVLVAIVPVGNCEIENCYRGDCLGGNCWGENCQRTGCLVIVQPFPFLVYFFSSQLQIFQSREKAAWLIAYDMQNKKDRSAKNQSTIDWLVHWDLLIGILWVHKMHQNGGSYP